MIEPQEPYAFVLLTVGAVIVASLLVRTQFPRLQLPAMVGYILIGMALSVAGSAFGLLTPLLRENLEFLAQLGVVVLLHGVMLGDWAVPEQLYIAAVFVSVATCILAPILVRRLLADRPQFEGTR